MSEDVREDDPVSPTLTTPPAQPLPARTPRQRSFLFTRDPSLSAEAAEDYAIRKVPYHWKRTPLSFVHLVFGAVTSVFAFALGGQIVLSYGVGALIVSSILGFLIGAPLAALIAWQTANSSIDSDLLSRGAGYGFLGSTASALVYGMNFLMYAGFEAAFLGSAIHAQWSGPPLWLLYFVTAMVLVPLNWYGVSQIDWILKWTVPLFFVGLVWIAIEALGRPAVTLDVPAFGAKTVLPALAAIMANMAIWILLVGDYSRFVRKSERRKVVSLTIIVAMGGEFLFMTMIGGLLALHTDSANPGGYAVALIGIPGLLWIVITQVRIQEGNYYSGSLSLVNFFARVFHWQPGRRFFVVVVGFAAFLLAYLKIVDHLTQVLTFMGVFLSAWIGTIVYSLLSTRDLMRSGELWIEHRRGYLRDWGGPAIAGLVAGSAVGAPLAITNAPEPYGGFLGLVLSGTVAVAVQASVARLMPDPMHVIARMPDVDWRDTNQRSDVELEAPDMQVRCGACGSTVMKPDACTCPVSPDGVICSSCCASHATCRDVCKSPAGVIVERSAL